MAGRQAWKPIHDGLLDAGAGCGVSSLRDSDGLRGGGVILAGADCPLPHHRVHRIQLPVLPRASLPGRRALQLPGCRLQWRAGALRRHCRHRWHVPLQHLRVDGGHRRVHGGGRERVVRECAHSERKVQARQGERRGPKRRADRGSARCCGGLASGHPRQSRGRSGRGCQCGGEDEGAGAGSGGLAARGNGGEDQVRSAGGGE
mmetsp:Transcript_9056/g.17710  ORF Transcript_9056/g.17710 Transcript_9056/m.17710 type:complete len:203 (+) Transcript_9056:87-695(+)